MRLAIALLACTLASCSPADQERVITPPAIEDVTGARLEDFGSYEQVVALETREGALLGSVDRIVIDPATGDLLVGDFRSSRRVHRFGPDGRYLVTYGDSSLDGQHSYVSDVAVLGDGRVLLLAGNRGLVFAADGALERTVFFDFAANEVVVLGDRFYVRGHSVEHNRLKHAVHIFDDKLEAAGSFHPYDRRRDRYAFVPSRSLATLGGRIYVSEIYDFQIASYDADGRPGPVFDFPDHNADLAEVWRLDRSELTDAHKARLRDGVHRSRALLGAGEQLFFVESQIRSKLSDPGLLWPERAAVRRFPGLQLIANPKAPADGDDAFLLDQLVGSYDGGLLGICDDPARIGRFRDRLTLLRDLDFAVTDNPPVFFLRIAGADRRTSHG